MKLVSMLTLILLIVGGLNWALFAFGINLVSIIFGAIPVLEKLVYILVGASAVYQATKIGKN